MSAYVNETAENEIGECDAFGSELDINCVGEKVEEIIKHSIIVNCAHKRVQLGSFFFWLIQKNGLNISQKKCKEKVNYPESIKYHEMKLRRQSQRERFK